MCQETTSFTTSTTEEAKGCGGSAIPIVTGLESERQSCEITSIQYTLHGKVHVMSADLISLFKTGLVFF